MISSRSAPLHGSTRQAYYISYHPLNHDGSPSAKSSEHYEYAYVQYYCTISWKGFIYLVCLIKTLTVDYQHCYGSGNHSKSLLYKVADGPLGFIDVDQIHSQLGLAKCAGKSYLLNAKSALTFSV